MRKRMPLERRYAVDEATGCWLWSGSRDADGYGRLRLNYAYLRAHRWVYEELVGVIPRGLVLDHVCGVRHCVNPAHLEPVTNVVNIRRGQNSKLTNQDALRIRSELDRICEQYDISPTALRHIAARTTWSEVA